MTRISANNDPDERPSIRPIADVEHEEIEQVFLRLRERFSVWAVNYPPGYELELAKFAYYEGCGVDEHELEEAAPLAVLLKLADGEWQLRDREQVRIKCDASDFTWCMVKDREGWDFAVQHELLDVPVTKRSLLAGEWTRESYDEPMSPGEQAIDALWYIPLAIWWKRKWGRDKPIPDVTADELRGQLLAQGCRLPWG